MRASSLLSFVAGGGAAAGLTYLVLALISLPGLIVLPGLSFLALGMAGLSVAVFAAQRSLEKGAFRAGAGAVLVVLVGLELLGGPFGSRVVRLVAIGATLAVAVLGPGLLEMVTKRVPRSVIGLGFGCLVLVLIRIVIESGELGHDESAYALLARSWLFGTPDTGWTLHRGLGQSVIAAAVLPFTLSPLALRGVAVVLSLATLIALWALGREIGSGRVGVFAAATFAVAPTFLRRGTEFLTDMPSAGLLFLTTLLVWRWLTSPTPSPGVLYAATGVAAVAYYVRYQSLLSLGLVVIGAAASHWPRVRQSLPQLLRAAGLGVVLLVPHFIHSTIATGTPWGTLLYTAGAGGRDYLGEGLVDYIRALPDLLAGQIGAGVLLVGLVWALWRLTSAAQRPRVVFLLVPSLGQLVLLGLVSHGEPRFVFFPVGLLLVTGSLAIEDLRRRVPSWVYRAAVWVVAAALLGSLAFHGQRFDANAEARAESIDVLVQAARAVVAETGGRCGIVTGMLPQMTWLSGCETHGFSDEPEISFPDDVTAYLLLTDGGPRQPTGERLERYLALTEGEPIEIQGTGRVGWVRLWRIR